MKAHLPLFALGLYLVSFSVAGAHGNEALRVRLPDETITHTPWTTVQAATFAKQGSALGRFAAAHPTWEFQVDVRTGSPHRAWGRGVQIEGFSKISEDNIADAAWTFLRDNAAMLQIDPTSVRLVSTQFIGEKAQAVFQQTWRGYDVLNAYIRIRMTQDGRVFLFGSDAFPVIETDEIPSIGAAAARAFATAGFPEEPAADAFEDLGVHVLPLVHPTHVEHRLVRNVIVRLHDDEHWDTYVDAASGEVLWRRNLIMQFRAGGGEGNATTAVVNGRVTMRVSPVSWLYGDTVLPVRDQFVTVAGTTVVTDSLGRFSVDIGSASTATLVARLSGPWARARRADSTQTMRNAYQMRAVQPGQDVELVWDDANSHSAERSVFHHMNMVRNFTRSFDAGPLLSGLDRQMDGIVNKTDIVCNAFWNGRSVNFAKAGMSGTSDCGNTGEIADVIYHEYGHAINTFIYQRVTGRSMRDGALSEATADITANMLRDDPRIGIGFMKGSGDGTIRNADNTLRYPQNLVGEIHIDGMILTGAVWDMREALGIDLARRLTHEARNAAPDGANHGDAFADYFLEILAADDDDGDLSNGTPHSAAIVEAFVRHGIPASAMTLAHQALTDQPDGLPGYPVSGTVAFSQSIIENLLRLEHARIRFTTDDWKTSDTVDMEIDQQTRTFGGVFPAQPAGSIVRYYVEVADAYGSVTRTPAGASHLFLVGYRSRINETFDTDAGWTVATDASSGAWVRERPIGTYDKDRGTPPDTPWLQPDADNTTGDGAISCWVTGNAQAVFGMDENDVDDGKTVLTTRTYDLRGMNAPILRYFRWFANYQRQGGTGSGRWTSKISDDGGATWKSIEFSRQHDPQWAVQIVRLEQHVALTDKFVAQFTASDAAPGAIVEAALDDFEILESEGPVSSADALTSAHDVQLEQNYPNPFNPSTTISFTLPVRAQLRLSVQTLQGVEVATLVDAVVDAGRHHVVFDGSSLASGHYLVQLRSSVTGSSDVRVYSRIITLVK